ncbi:MAG TPA: hypothetical protein VJT80_00425 [Steroidobacteraceae bacterium]|nr:hypothetical protein [Steroidobacteraceae bacterium]
MLKHRVFLFGCVLAALAPTLVGQSAKAELASIHPRQSLPTPPDPDPSASLSFARAVTDGRTIVVSVRNGPAAYAYSKTSRGRWVYEATLAAAPPQGIASTGIAVRGKTALVQGTIRAVGAPQETAVAFVFRHDKGAWTYTQTLSNASLSLSRLNPLALGHDFAAVGSFAADNLNGAVFIYDRVGAGTYALETKLAPAAAAPLAFTGATVIVDGARLLAYSGGVGNNIISSFVRTGGVWFEEPSLRLPDGGVLGPDFGFSGKRAVVAELVPPGPARVFVRDHDGIWSVEQTLTNPVDPQTNLGPGAAMDGRRLLITDTGRKAVYVFERSNANWVATAQLVLPAACEPLPTIALSGRLAVVTCRDVDTGDPVWHGQVLVYELAVPSGA